MKGRNFVAERTTAVGLSVIRKQCIDCGLRIGQAVKRPPDADELPEFDDAKHDAYKAARKAALSTVDQKYVEIQLRRWKGKEDGDSYYRQAHSAYLEFPRGRTVGGWFWSAPKVYVRGAGKQARPKFTT